MKIEDAIMSWNVDKLGPPDLIVASTFYKFKLREIFHGLKKEDSPKIVLLPEIVWGRNIVYIQNIMSRMRIDLLS